MDDYVLSAFIWVGLVFYGVVGRALRLCGVHSVYRHYELARAKRDTARELAVSMLLTKELRANMEEKRKAIHGHQKIVHIKRQNITQYRERLEVQSPHMNKKNLIKHINLDCAEDVLRLTQSLKCIELLEREIHIITATMATVFESASLSEHTLVMQKMTSRLADLLSNLNENPDTSKIHDDIEKNINKAADVLDGLQDRTQSNNFSTAVASSQMKNPLKDLDEKFYDQFFTKSSDLFVEESEKLLDLPLS